MLTILNKTGLIMPVLRLLLVTVLVNLPLSFLLAAEQTVQLADGTSVKLLFFEPHTNEGPPPLAMLIAAGSNNEFMAKAQFWLGKAFVDRGWAIAVPIAPDGRRFSQEESNTLPEIVEILQSSHSLQDSKPLLIGISSGGSEAMAIAALNPEKYKGVVATPGRLKADTSVNALQGLPVYIRIGERDDFRWNRLLQAMVERLRAAGARVDYAIVNNARHVFRIDWNNLEVWLSNLE